MSRVLVAMAFMATGVSTASSPLRVKASPAVAPCVAAASIAYERAAGQGVALSIGELGSPASAGGADVVIGADQELNRIIESGASAPDLDVDVARIPWVLVAAVGAPAMDVRSLGRTGALVRTLDGVVAREAWRNLAQQGLAPGRVERVRELRSAFPLQAGEAAIVPLSLAGSGPVSSLAVPPLVVRALGVRASAHTQAAGAFLAFLTSEKGNAAFQLCGRTEAQ
jgi:hypothetical protein